MSHHPRGVRSTRFAAQGLLAAHGLLAAQGFVTEQGFPALDAEERVAGWHGLCPAATGFAETAMLPKATAAPSAISVFLKETRLKVNIDLTSFG